ncbi:MAG TPA: hypothetical protein VE913_04930 [Longimicrobium sp.]|nr:hypothetical protein [Longimicrobium sp.]
MRRYSTVRPTAAACLALFALNGCFSYVPMNGPDPLPGARVRVELRSPQQIRAGEVTANDVVSVIGEVISADTSLLVLSASQLTARSGYELSGGGETARLPRGNIVVVSQNRLSVLRTALVAGAIAVLGGTFASQVRASRGGGGGGGGGTPN